MIGSSGVNDPLDTNKPLPQAPGSTGTSLGGASSTLGSGRDLPDRTVGQYVHLFPLFILGVSCFAAQISGLESENI